MRSCYRYFVRQDGLERCHRFTDGEARELITELVSVQLAAAAYPNTTRFDPAAVEEARGASPFGRTPLGSANRSGRRTAAAARAR